MLAERVRSGPPTVISDNDGDYRGKVLPVPPRTASNSAKTLRAI
jgi:hypothetical protein